MKATLQIAIIFAMIFTLGLFIYLGTTSQGMWKVSVGEISFLGSHPTQFFSGKTNKLTSQGKCTSKNCLFIVRANLLSLIDTEGPIASDLIVTTAKVPRLVAAKVLIPNPKLFESDSIEITTDLLLTIAGKTKTIKNIIIYIQRIDMNSLFTKGDFTVELGDFFDAIPSVMSVAVKEKIKIHFSLNWSRTSI